VRDVKLIKTSRKKGIKSHWAGKGETVRHEKTYAERGQANELSNKRDDPFLAERNQGKVSDRHSSSLGSGANKGCFLSGYRRA